jgi:hypothetical protein
VDDEFTTRVLDSMSFNAFVVERGPPYRICDIFDEVFASMPDMLRIEDENPDRLLHNIRDLAQQLYMNVSMLAISLNSLCMLFLCRKIPTLSHMPRRSQSRPRERIPECTSQYFPHSTGRKSLTSLRKALQSTV